MAMNIPEDQLRFSQLAVQQGLIQPEQARAAMELMRRYQTRGGEVPSIARILVNKGWLGRKQGEQILRHIHSGDPLPGSAGASDASMETIKEPPKKKSEKNGTAAQSSRGLPATSSSKSLPATRSNRSLPAIKSSSNLPATQSSKKMPAVSVPALSSPNAPIPKSIPPLPPRPKPKADSESAILKGMGALVLSKELLEIKGYKIDSVVGEGAMGIVYKAVQLSMDRDVALKVLPPERTKDTKFVEEFLTEARNAGRLNHPNLIRVHEVARSGSLFYYSMEFVDGQRLDEMMDEYSEGRMEAKRAVQIFSQAASALEYGLRAGIVHREIRPNAIMITSDGHAKLADLGLVKDEETRFTIGENAYYVAPEQAQGRPGDTRSDIYSLGCCLFQALTGERPFDDGGTPKEVMLRRLTGPVPIPQQFNSRLSAELSRVVVRMMQRDPAMRYQTPGDVVEALKKLSFSAHAQTPPKTSGTAVRRRFKR